MSCLLLLTLSVIYSALAIDCDLDMDQKRNTMKHQTNAYRDIDNKTLIVRRAQSFTIHCSGCNCDEVTHFTLTPVSFNGRPLRGASEILVAVEEPRACPPDNALRKRGDDDEFCASLTDGVFTIRIPATAAVAPYHLAVDNSTKPHFTVIILFNPFVAEDVVYMKDSDQVREYVLNEQGLMWQTLTQRYGSGWTFDQFDSTVLSVTFSFLDMLPWDSRNDVVLISRHLSSRCNANNGPGLMYGRWREPYSDGKAPWMWVGSGDIYKTYAKTQQPVKWGQCWVFAGVLVSAGRTLGIPARQITNFDSAHEDPKYGWRNTVDFFFDKNGNQTFALGSIWNFHAWTEFWFNRPEINDQGWQAVDATPQEISDRLYQLGPASVNLVKANNLKVKYDAEFVSSETNADIRQYVAFDTGKPKHPYVSGYWLSSERLGACGNSISTKKPLAQARLDITANYKHARLSNALSDSTASAHSRAGVHFEHRGAGEVEFNLTQPTDVAIGDTLNVEFGAYCSGCSAATKRIVVANVWFSVIGYDGGVVATLLQKTFSFDAGANLPPTNFAITREMYQNYLGDDTAIVSDFFARVVDEKGNFTGQYFTQRKRYELDEPDLDVTLLNVTLTSFYVTVEFRNPLSIKLTDTVLQISGAWLKDQEINLGAVPADFFFVSRHVLVRVTGWPLTKRIVASVKVTCNEISRMENSIYIDQPTSSNKLAARLSRD